MTTRKKAAGNGKETITLKRDHTHQEKTWRKGDTIEVRPAQAEWLRKHGVA